MNISVFWIDGSERGKGSTSTHLKDQLPCVE